MQRVNVIYNDSLDGAASAAIISYYMSKNTDTECTIKLYEFSQNTQLKDIIDDFNSGDPLYILDYTFDIRSMEELVERVGLSNVIWIDHDRKSFEKLKNFKGTVNGIRYEGLSSSELTVLYMHGYRYHDKESFINSNEASGLAVEKVSFIRDRKIPRGIRLLGDYITRGNQFQESSYLWHACTIYNTKAENSNFWEVIIYDKDNKLAEIIEKGRICFNHAICSSIEICDKYAQEVKLLRYPKYRCVAINTCDNYGDLLFSAIYDYYHIGITFTSSGNEMTFNIYRLGLEPELQINIDKIVSSYNGGDRSDASRFTTKNKLPFEYNKKGSSK